MKLCQLTVITETKFQSSFGTMSFLFGNRSSKTFKPKKNIPEGSKQHELMQHAAATLGSGVKYDYTNQLVGVKEIHLRV